VIVWLICRVYVLGQWCSQRNACLAHRSFYRKLNSCCAVFALLFVTDVFLKLIHHGQKKRANLSVKQKLELIEKLESGVFVTCVCEEYGVKKQTVSDIRKAKRYGHSSLSDTTEQSIKSRIYCTFVSLNLITRERNSPLSLSRKNGREGPFYFTSYSSRTRSFLCPHMRDMNLRP
jgi:hypothetical protein